jgi:Flp pilus assembly protein TadD
VHLRARTHYGLPAAAVVVVTVVLLVRDQGGYFPPSWGWTVLALGGVVVTWLLVSARADAGFPDAAFLLALLALTAWVGLSIAWSVDRPQSVLELERGLVLLVGCAVLLALVRRHMLALVVPALVAAIAGICAYSLSTRLAPTAGAFRPGDPVSRYRLFEPIGYWNGLGIFAVLGILLALALATEPTARIESRLLGAVSLVVLPVTLFFTFSRGAWLALAVGLLAAAAASPHRLRVTAAGAAFAVVPAVAVLLAWRAGPLTNAHTTLAAATRAGHRLAVELVLLAVASIAVVPAVRWLERRVRIGVGARRGLGVALIAVVAGAIAIGLARSGGPVSIATRGYHSFVDPVPPRERGSLTGRLGSVNGNGRPRMWSVAIDALHGGGWAIGTGAGSFQRNWERSKRANEVVRDAHGLYVETLSELGVIGLVLLVATLLIPLAAGLRRRRTPLVALLTGAYAAFLLHLAVDWDWELSGVALTGLFVGCLLLVARRDDRERVVALAPRAVAAAAGLAVATFAFVGLVGNTALARAQSANRNHRYTDAAGAARKAHRWMPWSPDPYLALGEARLEEGDTAGARASFRAAISLDRSNWQSWLDLAASMHGAARRRAVARARSLYPRGPEITEFEREEQDAGSRH